MPDKNSTTVLALLVVLVALLLGLAQSPSQSIDARIQRDEADADALACAPFVSVPQAGKIINLASATGVAVHEAAERMLPVWRTRALNAVMRQGVGE